MDSLLRWSIENSANGTGPAPAPRKDLDPAIIDHILGKPDAVVMKEALTLALDKSKDVDDRVVALDEFEMLVEHIDNATDMKKLDMWAPLQGMLNDPDEEDLVKRQVLWVVGTAVQNNPQAQQAYLSYSPIPTVLAFLSPSTPPKTRAKAVYALSGILKHSALAVSQLSPQAWESLRAALEDSDINVRRKTAFLLGTLLTPSAPIPHPSSQNTASTRVALRSESDRPDRVHPNTHASMVSDPTSTDTSTPTQAALRDQGLLNALVNGLLHPVPYGADGDTEGDVDFEEKVVSTLSIYVTSCHGTLSPEQKLAFREYLEQDPSGERWNLSSDEHRALYHALS